MGAIQNYVFFELILGGNEEMPMPEETYLRGLVNVLWNGIAPKAREER